MDGTGVTSFSAHGGGAVNVTTQGRGVIPWNLVEIMQQPDGTVNIGVSIHVPPTCPACQHQVNDKGPWPDPPEQEDGHSADCARRIAQLDGWRRKSSE